ncbi:hypothetical protein GCM10009839_33790 [Catenulispora yoronensis]|uniref:pPIWI-RE three-gene island domain-containing protein n=1 Tax=Catenulispora yoronensis TaxID=450799 RepID=A0ABP5FRJ7_9ACTN
MRNRSGWHDKIVGELKAVWPAELAGDFSPGDLCDVELGLHLLLELTPQQPAASGWTLLGGYPYAEALGYITTEQQRHQRDRARHYLWQLRRQQVWHTKVGLYLQVPQELRAFDLADVWDVPVRRHPSMAARRGTVYATLLASAPPFERKPLPIAGAGEYTFRQGDRRHAVTFDAELLAGPALAGHDLAPVRKALQPLGEVPWKELVTTAEWMDAEEIRKGIKPRLWTGRLARVELFIPSTDGRRFDPAEVLPIANLLHLVGMVGAGKSTLRDILTVWAARNGYRTTVVVGDVAETLATVRLYSEFDLAAAPVLGHSTRQRNASRLHRRLASSGAPSMLAHDDPGFDYVTTACPVDALRGAEAAMPLAVREAPCTSLFPVERTEDDAADTLKYDDGLAAGPVVPTRRGKRPRRHGCALWSQCPRHHGARALVDADIWVATPAGLVHSSVPDHLNDEQLRYMELAVRRSDLIIVDEADRVQMQLDTAFCPAATLSGRSPESWLDEVQGHKITELARQGRIQLSNFDVDDWATAVNTVTSANDRLYRLLVQKPEIRSWVGADYFSSFTLHGHLLDAWFPRPIGAVPDEALTAEADGDSAAGEAEAVRLARRAEVDRVLNDFRDDPLGHKTVSDPMVDRLVRLTLELLHAPQSATTRRRMSDLIEELAGPAPALQAQAAPVSRGRRSRHGIDDDQDVPPASPDDQFEFTLLLAALHTSLDYMTTLWARVEAALNLESTSNVLSRRPPKDYEPLIPESPMGNILGFQFRADEQTTDGERSGELLFFRCGGVGRELLPAMATWPQIDGRHGPKLLLMSATSWSGTSSRYHLRIPVGAVLRPHREEVEAILGTTFRKDIQYGKQGPLRLSGEDPKTRAVVLRQMLDALAKPANFQGARSKFAAELDQITDPERRRLLILTGSYEEAERAAEHLNRIEEWKGRVVRLVSDDADLDDSWTEVQSEDSVKVLRRGELATFPHGSGQLLVAPLLAVERGHNIVMPGGKAAIGTVYFLARPHPRPDDITLAIHAINDWAVREVHGGAFAQRVRAAGSLDAAGRDFRREARGQWTRFMTRTIAWNSLEEQEKKSFAWDQLVVMWQVIGRLVRGGVPARVVLVDAAFYPREAGLRGSDTPDTSLIEAMRALLEPYFDQDSGLPELDRALVRALYEPLHKALADL